MPKVKLRHHDNLKIVSLFQQGWPIQAIVRRLASEGIDITWKAVKHVVKRYQEGKICYEYLDKEQIPVFKSVKESDAELVKTALADDPTLSSTDVLRRLTENGANTCKSTVRKVIDAVGYTATVPRYGQMIRNENKEKRMDFCRKLIAEKENFDNIIFTDECTVQLHNNKAVVYRKKDSAAPVLPKPKHPLKVHVWGGISRRGSTKIIIFEGILKSDFFVNTILKLGLLPFIQETYPHGHRFQQDNDPKHRSALCKEFMKENNVNWWDIWPSESPDFNPIEMVWSAMKQKLGKMELKTKDELVRAIQTFWKNDLTVESCNTYIDHLYKVIPVALVCDGRATGDLPKKLLPERSRLRSLEYFNNKLKSPEYREKITTLMH